MAAKIIRFHSLIIIFYKVYIRRLKSYYCFRKKYFQTELISNSRTCEVMMTGTESVMMLLLSKRNYELNDRIRERHEDGNVCCDRHGDCVNSRIFNQVLGDLINFQVVTKCLSALHRLQSGFMFLFSSSW